MNHTANYQLSQWEAGDKVQRVDFNADNAKIDAAIKAVEVKADALAGGKADASVVEALSQTVAGHSTTLAGKGNCQVYATSYTGAGRSGQENQNALTFPYRPMAIFFTGPETQECVMIQGQGNGASYNVVGSMGGISITWSGNTVRWYASSDRAQMNQSNTLYRVVAFLSV